jgi:hypothetical protein
MKRFFCLLLSVAVLALAPMARADDDSHSSDIANLSYYPRQGKFLLTPRLTFSVNDQSSSESNGSPTGSSAIAFSRVDAGVTYGVIDGLRLGVSETELFNSATTHTAGANTTLTRTSGLSDPTFSAFYRYCEQDAKGLAADLGLTFSPSWVQHTVASTTENGSEGKGYGTLDISAPFYWWMGMNEVGLTPAFEHEFSGNGVGATTAASYNRGNASYFATTLDDRFHFTPKFFAQAGGIFYFPYSFQNTYTNNAATVRTTHEPFYVVPRLNADYKFLNNVLFDIEYDYYNYTTTVSETGASTKSIESTLAVRFFIEI